MFTVWVPAQALRLHIVVPLGSVLGDKLSWGDTLTLDTEPRTTTTKVYLMIGEGLLWEQKRLKDNCISKAQCG